MSQQTTAEIRDELQSLLDAYVADYESRPLPEGSLLPKEACNTWTAKLLANQIKLADKMIELNRLISRLSP